MRCSLVAEARQRGVCVCMAQAACVCAAQAMGTAQCRYPAQSTVHPTAPPLGAVETQAVGSGMVMSLAGRQRVGGGMAKNVTIPRGVIGNGHIVMLLATRMKNNQTTTELAR